MTNGNDSAYARPAMRDEKGEQNRDDILSHDGDTGLTKREHFAAMAMQGLLAGDVNRTATESHVAQWSIMQADALIEALNAETK